MVRRKFSTERVPLPPGFKMFILPEYRLVTPTYSVRLSRSHGMLVAALLANYERHVLRWHLEDSLWGHLKDGGPQGSSNTISVMLAQIRTRFGLVGVDLTLKSNWWHGRDRAIIASGLGECEPVGCPNNPVRLRALWDRQSPNPALGLPKPKPPRQKRQPKPKQKEQRPRYSYVERQRPPGVWTHNARAEASFGDRGPK